MIQTLRILESNLDNERDGESSTLKQAICCPDSPQWRESIQVKYDSLITNVTEKLLAIPKN